MVSASEIVNQVFQKLKKLKVEQRFNSIFGGKLNRLSEVHKTLSGICLIRFEHNSITLESIKCRATLTKESQTVGTVRKKD